MHKRTTYITAKTLKLRPVESLADRAEVLRSPWIVRVALLAQLNLLPQMRGKCAQKKLRTCDLGCEIKDVFAVDHESTMLFTLSSPVVTVETLACFRLNLWRRLKSRDFWVSHDIIFKSASIVSRVAITPAPFWQIFLTKATRKSF